MSKLSLLQKIQSIATITLNFVGLTVEKTKDGENVAILQLETPLAYVRGSQEIEVDGKKVPITASDVTEVKVHQADLEEADDDFEFDEDTDSGSYKGDKLILDVTQQGQVWLRKTSFRSSGNTMRQKSKNDRFANIAKAQEERAAKARQAKSNDPVVTTN